MMETHDIFYEFGRLAGNQQGAGYAMEAGIFHMAQLANAGVLDRQKVRHCLTFVLKQFGDDWGWSGEIEDALAQMR
jgi:hypothetical protein